MFRTRYLIIVLILAVAGCASTRSFINSVSPALKKESTVKSVVKEQTGIKDVGESSTGTITGKQCHAVLPDGSQCSKPATPGSEFCPEHSVGATVKKKSSSPTISTPGTKTEGQSARKK